MIIAGWKGRPVLVWTMMDVGRDGCANRGASFCVARALRYSDGGDAGQNVRRNVSSCRLPRRVCNSQTNRTLTANRDVAFASGGCT
jgi:hypothetical protein